LEQAKSAVLSSPTSKSGQRTYDHAIREFVAWYCSEPRLAWVKHHVDAWTAASAITHGPVFRAINKAGRVWGDGMSPKVLWDVVRAAATRAGIDKLAPHDLRRACARLCISRVANWTRFSSCSGTSRFRRQSATSDASRSSA
jgi:hypothetical protein